MACFLVPVTEALVVTAVTKIVRAREKAAGKENERGSRLLFSDKLQWLNKMLWGGSALLCFEHLWHGEVVPFFPFLTALGSAEDTAVMLREMSTVGVGMAALVTLAWVGMLLAAGVMAGGEAGVPEPVKSE